MREVKAMNELKLEAKVEKLGEAIAFIDQILETEECPLRTQMQIDVAVEELFVNIANYAYAPGTGSVKICAGIGNDPKEITIIFIDCGVPYDPSAKTDPDITLSAEDRQIGGLGIFMAKKSMDSLEYERKDGQNILTIRTAI